MPQNITGQPLNTITLPATDLATVTFSGGGPGANVWIWNYGPGKVMVSNNPNITPTMTSTNCLLLGAGAWYRGKPMSAPATFLLIADTASTVVALSCF